MSLLEIKDLSIHYVTENETFRAVNHVSLAIEEGETLGLVGETGAGKTTTALGILNLIPNPPGKIVGGEILFRGENVLKKRASELRKIRGNEISMIFQDPMTALNPVIRIGDQIAEAIRLHNDCSKAEATARSLEMLRMVGIGPERSGNYRHELSGGMKQRVVIAMALACNPALLIADEPTTALDVTIQAQVLNMMNDLKERLGTSVLLITHDLGIIAECCQRLAVMYAGEIVEYGTLEQIFHHTAHPYTVGLFNSIPSLDRKERRLHPIDGLMPDPARLPEGCYFSPRCPYADERCKSCHPELCDRGDGHMVRCLKRREEMGETETEARDHA